MGRSSTSVVASGWTTGLKLSPSTARPDVLLDLDLRLVPDADRAGRPLHRRPSTVMIAACSNGEQKNEAAACDMWCSQKDLLRMETSLSRISGLIHSLSTVTQRRIDSVKNL